MADQQENQDICINYTNADRPWAEWIAWAVEENVYTPILQSWDVHLDDNWQSKVKEIEASLQNQLSVILLSESFLEKLGAQIKLDPMGADAFIDIDAENRAAFELSKVFIRQLKGPLEFLPNSQLLPIRVANCQLVKPFEGIKYLDLVGLSESEAEKVIAERLEVLSGGTTADSQDNLMTAPGPSLDMVTGSAQFMQKRRSLSVECFVEHLNDDLSFEMMSIPAGKFLMGSPEDELKRRDNEGPQHEVTVSQFFMAKYPVTQAQWRVVAAMPQVHRELEPDPSEFKGDDRPVEQVSWDDAVEFCDRISQHTNRPYRLPTEAEWEYACRAGTTTPFHFGETITTDLANYRGTDNDDFNWSGSYGSGPKGAYRKETTPVDHFDIANAFGLCDMHGNVWEWCQDHWHGNYDGAPTNGNAWLTDDKEANRVLRGGSWIYGPESCRSARRSNGRPVARYTYVGFRVVSAPPRSLP